MIRCIALLALLAACGRWKFDEISRDDAGMAGGHDEDGDGLPDAIDLCPQIAGDNADADGDGVGDACDPYPATPTERITLFATMQPGDVPFVDMPGWVQNADSAFGNVNPGGVPATNALSIARAVGTARIDVRFTIAAINGTTLDQHQVACGLEGTVPFYFAELNDNTPAQQYLGITSYDPTNGYLDIARTDLPAPLHTGPGLLRFDVSSTDRTWSVEAGWTGELYTASGATPSYTGADTIRFVVNALDLDVQSVTIVETL